MTASLYLTIEDYCYLTGAKPDTVRWQLRNGKLSGRKTKGGWRILASAVKNKED